MGALALSVTVLVGWSLGSHALERIVSGLPVMTPWTAVGLGCAGAAIVCLSMDGAPKAVGWTLGALAAVIGLLVAFEYLIAPLGIDQLLFAVPGTVDPGRPSPQTTIALIGIGLVLTSVDRPGRVRWVHDCALLVTVVVELLVCVGYVYGVETLRGLSATDGMALHTLAGFIVLTVGAVALRPGRGISDLLRGRDSAAIVARAMLPVGVVPILSGAVVFALMHDGVLGARAGLSVFTIAMVVLAGSTVFILALRVRTAEGGTQELASRLQALFDNAPAALSLRDGDGRYVHINEYGAAMIGKRPGELIGRRPADPVLVAGITADDLAAARLGRSVVHEQQIQHVDGTIRDLHVVRYPVLDGAVVRGFGTFAVDITESKRVSRELELAQEQFRSAFEAAPIGMMLQALDGTIEQVNPAMSQLTGRSTEELVRGGVAAIVADEDLVAEATARRRLRRDGSGSQVLGLRYQVDDGRRIDVDVHLTVVRGPDGAPLRYLAQVQDTTERRNHQRELEHLADHDPLTNLLNRRAFVRALERHAAPERRRGAGAALIAFDLDRLKAVNDTLGHHAGDELIVRTARICTAQLRTTDLIARLGGDEFAILLPATAAEAAVDVAESLLAALNAGAAVDGTRASPINASVGVTTVAAFPGESPETCLQRADAALYLAKRDGGNRVRSAAAPELDQPAPI